MQPPLLCDAKACRPPACMHRLTTDPLLAVAATRSAKCCYQQWLRCCGPRPRSFGACATTWQRHQAGCPACLRCPACPCSQATRTRMPLFQWVFYFASVIFECVSRRAHDLPWSHLPPAVSSTPHHARRLYTVVYTALRPPTVSTWRLTSRPSLSRVFSSNSVPARGAPQAALCQGEGSSACRLSAVPPLIHWHFRQGTLMLTQCARHPRWLYSAKGWFPCARRAVPGWPSRR